MEALSYISCDYHPYQLNINLLSLCVHYIISTKVFYMLMDGVPDLW